MKRISIVGFINDNTVANDGKMIGSIGIDRSSGGYPWIRDPGSFPQDLTHSDYEKLFESLITLNEYNASNLNLETSLFIQEFEEVPGYRYAHKSTPFRMKFMIIEIDHSEILNIKTKILRTAEVSARPAYGDIPAIVTIHVDSAGLDNER